jgi:flagellar export protein FliJ
VKKFQFPYQRVMEWRDRCAEQERHNLAQLHASRSRLERERESIEESIGRSHAAFASPTTSSAEDLRHLAAFVGALRTKEEAVKHHAAECQQHIEAQTRRCTEVSRDHELLVRLRARHATTWQAEFDKELEQGAADSWLSGRARQIARKTTGEIG